MRVLVVSADMGGGHNATAAALEEEITRRWPGSETFRVDALDLMGGWVGRAFRRIYVSNVEITPWLYEFFYASLWRHRWFAEASKRFTGSWCGRRLIAPIDRIDPDLIVSTYPLGTSGLAWLRRHRGLAVPTGAWVSDFSPHPFWVYRDVDLNVVLHEAAAVTARAAEPGARVVVGAPPVVSRFAPGDRAAAREATGLLLDRFTVVVSAGSYSFGDVAGLVGKVLGAAPEVQVVAVCGRNEPVRSRLAALGVAPERLHVRGWVNDMDQLVRAADVVLTNAGGATALEALASGTAVVMYAPIAAHGVANADLMVVSGLADLVTDADRLGEWIAAAARDRSGVSDLERRIATHLVRADLGDALGLLAATDPATRFRPPRGRWPLRAGDAFFSHVETPHVRQEIGMVFELAPGPGGVVPELADLQALLAERVPRMPALRRVRVSGRRSGWRLVDKVEPADHVSEVVLADRHPAGEGDARQRALEVISDFWAAPLPPPDRPAWHYLLVRGGGLAGALVGCKMHHSVADGISALTLLVGFFDSDPENAEHRPTAPAPPRAHSAAGLVLRGLASLAAAGRAPRHPLNRPITTDRRQIVTWSRSYAELRDLAGELGVRPAQLGLGLLADALARLLPPAGLTHPDRPLRVMVPVAIRPARLDRMFGNWTGTIALDVPLAPMSFPERLAAVADGLTRRAERGEPLAAYLVMRLAGHLPGALHAVAARAAYGNRFFSSVLSYMPGPRSPRTFAGAPVREAYAVLPLAPGVPLTAGLVTFGPQAGVGMLLDPTLGLAAPRVIDALDEAWAGALAVRPRMTTTVGG